MAEVMGAVLAPAVGVMLSPLPIVGVILMLLSPKARINGPMFVLGWIAGLAIVLGLVLFLADPAGVENEDGEASTASIVIHLVIGLLLLGLAWRQWQQSRSDDAKLPGWMEGIDKITPIVALGLGALLSGLNPKNLMLDIAAATSIASATVSTSNRVIASVVFIVIASISVAGPVIWYFVGGQKAAARLDDLKGWLQANNATIMAVLLLVIGVSQIGKAIQGL